MTKEFNVEVKRTTYITYKVEATNANEAEEQALELAAADYGPAEYEATEWSQLP